MLGGEWGEYVMSVCGIVKTMNKGAQNGGNGDYCKRGSSPFKKDRTLTCKAPKFCSLKTQFHHKNSTL
jgi:hypothetical protein